MTQAFKRETWSLLVPLSEHGWTTTCKVRAFGTSWHTRAHCPQSPPLKQSCFPCSKMSLFKAVTIGNAFLLARRHDASPHVELLRYLELNLQVGSAIAELSIFIHYTSPQASFSACFAETCALLHSKKNSFFKLRGNVCFFTFLLFGNSTSKQWSLWRSQLNLEKKTPEPYINAW